MNEIAEFLRGASNVYRTRDYIVRQVIELHSDAEGSYLVSRDTYFRCTPRRDREYEEAFASRANVNGRRMPAAMHTRTYRE